MIKIPQSLKDQIINCDGILNQSYNYVDVTSLHDEFPKRMPTTKKITLEVQVYDIKAIECCYEWLNNYYFINIGPFVNMVVTNIETHHSGVAISRVTFEAEDYDPSKGTWQDWFIMGEREYETV